MDSIRRYLHSLRLVHYAILAAVMISAFTVSYYQISAADCYGGTVHGRTCYKGYFTNTHDQGGTYVLPEISNNQAIPSYINTVDELYDLLRDAYASSSNQRKTGAAFIYNTMHGGNAPGTGRTVSNAEWNDLYQRMKGLEAAGKINWTGNVSASINTYWQGVDNGFPNDGTNNDDAFYEQAKNEAGITFRDYNNNIVYEILRRCANPMGENSGIPPPRDYKLTPQVDTISPTRVEAGSKVSVGTSVDNEGDVQSETTQWEITKITVQPGQKAPHEDENGTTSATAPCQAHGGAASGNYFDSAVADCENVGKGSGRFNLGTPAQNLKPSVSGVDVGDLPVGTRVCFALSVQPRSNASDDWAHSKPICTVVGKKPKIQVWGGDVSVRGKIETSTSVKEVDGQTQTFGSWVEYGAFSVGANSKFASGSGLNTGNTSNTQLDWSKLTFANTPSGTLGNYANATNFPSAPAIASYFGAIQNTQAVSGSVDLSSLTFDTGGAIVVHEATNLTITGSSIPAGKSVVIVASGTVTIDDNIMYTDDTLTGVRSIPQVVIIAANINIRDSVSRVDSWLIASGSINTCYNLAGTLTSNKCNVLLEVNGPVVTNRLILNRTAGSETDEQSGDPAERFNLRADAFLWAQLQASGSNKAQTVYSTELPPRF